MPSVRLGNPAALDGGRVLEGEQVTQAVLPDNWTSAQLFTAITAPDGVWRNHSGATAPTWVESEDTALAVELSTHYGCPIKDVTAHTTDATAPDAIAPDDLSSLDDIPTLA